MSILLRGETTCVLCGSLILEGEEVVQFPAFVPTTKDVLFVFNDASVHKRCLERHPYKLLAIAHSNDAIYKTRPQNRRCDITGNEINKPDDCIFFGVLTSDKNEELHEFNLTMIDKNNLSLWKDKSRFLNSAAEFINSGKWGDLPGTGIKYLERLIDIIKKEQSK